MSGNVVPLSDVPDPVFSNTLLGPGMAIDPTPELGEAVSPVDGRLVKVHPHAFVVLHESGIGVLVHLGINTVRLHGEGFTVLAEEGSQVTAGTPVIRWDPGTITGEELSPMVPVVMMDRHEDTITVLADQAIAGKPFLQFN